MEKKPTWDEYRKIPEHMAVLVPRSEAIDAIIEGVGKFRNVLGDTCSNKTIAELLKAKTGG